MKIRLFVLAIISFLLIPCADSADRVYKVKINLEADDNIKSLAAGYLVKELGELKDVEIVFEGEEYVLHLLIMETHTTTGKAYGYIASVVELSPFTASFDAQLEMAGLDPDSPKLSWMRGNMSRLYQYRRHYFFTAPIEGLKSLCSQVVADFDKGTLAPARKVSRERLKIK